MHRSKLAAASLALVLALGAAPAGATVLSLQATLTLEFLGLPSIAATGGLVPGTVSNGHAQPFTVPVDVFDGHAGAKVAIVPSNNGLQNLSIPADSLGNAPGVFAPGSAAMPLSGTLFFNSGAAGSIPLGFVGGGAPQVGQIFSIPIKGSPQGPWQYASTAKIFATAGGVLGNSSSITATAFDNRNATGAGTVQLVAVNRIAFSGSIETVPFVATLTLTYTPEPATCLLLGAGVALLAAGGRRRSRRLR